MNGRSTTSSPAVQGVIDSNKLSGRDRDMLADDVSRMRDYREHHENWDRR